MAAANSEKFTKAQVWDDMIQDLRCFICKCYLSCSPLRVLPDGHNICGRCEPPSNDVPVYRMLDMENALTKVTFPCRFQQEGCWERMPFGHVFEHEDVCEYQTFTCFALPLGSCTWEGPTFKISEHFLESHAEYWMQEKEHFSITVEEDANQEMLVFEKHNVITIIQYNYDSVKKDLKLCIQYLAADTPVVFYNIEMYMEENRSSYVNIKHIPDKYQQTDINTSKKLTVFNIKPYIEILGNPDVIIFSVNLMLKHPSLNYDVLASLKCASCAIYVTPPLFKGSKDELLCSNCGKIDRQSRRYNDEELENLMAEVDYPCRWQRCHHIMKVDNIRKHEDDCLYREFNCPVLGCCKTYKRGKAIDHFEKYHVHKYLRDEIRLVLHIANPIKVPLKYFIVKDGEAILIECTVEQSKFRFEDYPQSMNKYVTVHFEHSNCNSRAKYAYRPNTIIDIKDVFRCCVKPRSYDSYIVVLTVR